MCCPTPISPPRNVRISTLAPRKGRSSFPTVSRCVSRAQRIRPGGCGRNPQCAEHHHCDRENDGEKGRRHEPGIGTRASPAGLETSTVKNPGHTTGPPDPRARVHGHVPGRRCFRADLPCLPGRAVMPGKSAAVQDSDGLCPLSPPSVPLSPEGATPNTSVPAPGNCRHDESERRCQDKVLHVSATAASSASSDMSVDRCIRERVSGEHGADATLVGPRSGES